MIVVDGQKAYQGAYAERVQNRQTGHQMTEAQKEASAGRVKEAVYDSLSVSEEGKNYLNRESEKTGSDKKTPEFVEYTRFYKDERIAKSQDSFWQNTGNQYLVFSQKLNESGFFDSMSDEEVREAESILSAITKGMPQIDEVKKLLF